MESTSQCILIAVRVPCLDYKNLQVDKSAEAMEQHTVLHPELDRILRENIPLVRGADDRQYYKLDYKVHATYYSAHCEYSLWFAGKNHGAVRVDYV